MKGNKMGTILWHAGKVDGKATASTALQEGEGEVDCHGSWCSR